MKFNLGTVLTLLLLIAGISASAADSAYIRFNFSPPLRGNEFTVTVHDGISEHTIDAVHHPYWAGILNAPYGFISVIYKNSDTTYLQSRVFFDKGELPINVIPSTDSLKYFTIDEKASPHIISYDKAGGAAFDAFIKERFDIFIRYYHENKHRFGMDTAALGKGFRLGDTLSYREMDFIRQFPDSYISFWTFLSKSVRTILLSPAKLMELYDLFPDKYKSTPAGLYLATIIQNKINIDAHTAFPDFTVTDIKNNKIESARLRGKYVLIQFWASWCAPCREELPNLKAYYDKYKNKDFELISFSIDKDSTAFHRAVEKYGMDWPQVFGDHRLYEAMANWPIPQLYLLDKSGRPIYNTTSIRDKDMTLLKNILEERLGK
ncbi:thiol-disulfide isomerase/thioredoxin [Chitinophaga polysaccharea]|uniref:Thiol-disulfide isomerase/thioredoxin n=1 Tax=Chitinophaga polysaccharea TaxID=1293035 RepID=A0A561PW40_9BACT|nr:TlpA disulfide reductase family protein [Chitinophaga polysaccharea]TWF42317.1 thiol-disulfide isomerase/thioredoxin [Chitinophaga polysaccharea]